MPQFADDDDLSEDFEAPADSEQNADFDEQPNAIIPCPYCRKPIHEDAELCPHCKSYISREDAPTRFPLWFLIGVALCLFVVIGWVLRGYHVF